MEYTKIIKATIDDAKSLQVLGRETFVETFAHHNTPGNLEAYLQKAFSVDALKKELADANSQWYVAAHGNEKAGYIKINFGNAQTEQQDGNTMEIERIYVLQKFQGKNIGKLLFEKAIAVAREYEANYVWLGVWEKNIKAISFYEKHGFITFSQHSFFLGDDEQTDLLMKLFL